MATDCRCTQEERIRALEESRAETRIYVKDIKDDLAEIKAEIRNKGGGGKEEFWQKLIFELVKLIGMSFTILTALWGVTKIIK